MLRAIMECRGKFSHKILRKAQFAPLHFDDLLNFRSVEKDRLSGKVEFPPDLPTSVLRLGVALFNKLLTNKWHALGCCADTKFHQAHPGSQNEVTGECEGHG